jgi:hypothetical protein
MKKLLIAGAIVSAFSLTASVVSADMMSMFDSAVGSDSYAAAIAAQQKIQTANTMQQTNARIQAKQARKAALIAPTKAAMVIQAKTTTTTTTKK